MIQKRIEPDSGMMDAAIVDSGHGLIIDTIAKRSTKKLTCKRDFTAGVYQSLYFQPSFVNCCPFNLLSNSTLMN
jgi:hypothetical protein